MRRPIGTSAIVVILAALTLLIGCGGGADKALTGPSVGTAGGKPAPPAAYTLIPLEGNGAAGSR